MTYLENGAGKNRTRLILAHGAGAPMDSPFMAFFAEKVGEAGIHVIRFEFPYMQQRRIQGSKRPPDRQPKLLTHWKEIIEESGSAENLIIGGKSMGGRMASLLADECKVGGLICLGYPFYAFGKQDKPRIEHLQGIKTPTLIVQGTRDTMGNKQTVENYTLSSSIEIKWMEDGDHSFKPRKSSGVTEEQNWLSGCNEVIQFIRSLS
ncbi:MAG: dienelactone hydrolase family protein [Sneathiella sp.]|nr:dienelactone hydrolase family protein [Sneathiella sp.]